MAAESELTHLVHSVEGDSESLATFHSVPEAFNLGFGIATQPEASFPAEPRSICGNVSMKSDSILPGTQIKRNLCFCGSPSVICQAENGRKFLTCLKGKCKYFRWADTVLDPPFLQLAHSKVNWRPLSPPIHKILPPDFSTVSEYVIQGSLGDCWFLSSLAVVCENKDRLDRLLDASSSNSKTVNFRFCHDGLWRTFSVDRKVPFMKTGKKAGHEAFACCKDNVAFGPLIEKAYAMMYGSYMSLHGGQVEEALFDLTGCPTEQIELTEYTEKDILWAKLKSWKDSEFLIGCATSQKIPSEDVILTGDEGQGLVTRHAYSVTDLIELHNVPVGKQTQITDFMGSSKQSLRETIECLRLVQIRNPWGKKEWTGDWSGRSDKWTRAIIDQLPSYSERNQRGKFWMDLNDFVQCFSEVDVAKTHKDWFSLAVQLTRKFTCTLNELLTGQSLPYMKINSNSNSLNWTYITLVHPSIRGKGYWLYYPDVHMILVREGKIVNSYIGFVDRVTTMEVMLEPNTTYELVLFTTLPQLSAHRDWKPVVRFFSAAPLTATVRNAVLSKPILSSDFEQTLVNKLPLVERISVGGSLEIRIHSSYCMAVFVLVIADPFVQGEIAVHVQLEKATLKTSGRWKYCVAGEIGNVVLGIITQVKNRYPNSGRLTGFTYDLELLPFGEVSPACKRPKPDNTFTATSTLANSCDDEVIELD